MISGYLLNRVQDTRDEKRRVSYAPLHGLTFARLKNAETKMYNITTPVPLATWYYSRTYGKFS